MKKVIVVLLLSFSGGFLFITGAMTGYVVWEAANESRVEGSYVDSPEGIEVMSHELVQGEKNLTVKALVANTSDTNWEAFGVELEIYLGELFLTSCHEKIRELAANSKREVLIACGAIQGGEIPDALSFKVRVDWARRKEVAG